MEQESSIAIIGAGASGCTCAYFLKKAGIFPTVFDYGKPLRTILPTGGGRCNFAHAEYDFKELAKNYPRGEKFLYSIFSKFSTSDTISLFEELGISSYTQDDGRIFPKSNSSKEVMDRVLKSLKDINFVKEKVTEIKPLDSGYKVKTNSAEYYFDKIIIATGGGTKINGIEKQTTTSFYPSLVGLKTDVKSLSGIVLKDVFAKELKLSGDILFTHFGISGPLIYKISSIKAKSQYPYTLHFDLFGGEFDLQSILNLNPHKELKNILSKYFPQRFANYISGEAANIEGCKINGDIREKITNKIHNFELTITGADKGEETVTCGGYVLDNINPKTMESKIYKGVYIIGESLDIDGFCGGFNLQNAWSTAFVAAEGIISAC